MKVEQKQLPRGQIEILFELSVEEYDPFLKKAAFVLSEQLKISGFRPGKAPYDIVKRHVGEMRLWEEALESAVKRKLLDEISAKNLITIGSPKIDVIKLVPGNPVIFKVVLNILPKIELLDYSHIKIARKKIEVTHEEVKKSLRQLQKMAGKEREVAQPAQKKNRVVVDFTAFLDNIPIQGGSQKNLSLIIGENVFIPDFEKNIIGMKPNEEKEFQVKFPENFHDKNYAGKNIDFKVKVISIFQIDLPELNDEFAKSIGGCQNCSELNSIIRKNLEHEAERKERNRLENELIHSLIAKSKVSDIPDILVNTETKKMIDELEYNIGKQGMQFDDYLKHINKTQSDLLLDFSPQALDRIKGALVTREIAGIKNIDAGDSEIDLEVSKIINSEKVDLQTQNKIKQTEFRDYIKNILISRKTMDYLIETMVI